jgi:hypothetical protein
VTKKETNLSGTLSEAVSVATSVAYTRQEIQKLKTEFVSLLEKKTTEVIVEQVPGPVGPRGALGATGTQGPKGDKGDKGDVGERGEKGDVGLQGEIGPEGLQGIKGDKGDTGEVGPQGIAGERGPQGLKGDRGEDGKNGLDGRDGKAGEIGPIGLTGQQGIQGERGAKGDTGEKGERGERGERGENGRQGIQGSVGPRGEIGPQGIQGIPGKDGKDADIKPVEEKFQKFIDNVQKDVNSFKTKVNAAILKSGPNDAWKATGSGEVNLRYLDDVDRDSITDGYVLSYDSANAKFTFVQQGGGDGTDQWARDQANAAYNYANTLALESGTLDTTARTTANSAWYTANLAYVTANSAWATANSALNQQSGDIDPFARSQANSAFNQANLSYIVANNSWSTANASYIQANTGTALAQAAYDYANTIVVPSLSGYAVNTTVNLVWSTANNAYAEANTAHSIGQAAYDYANTLTGGGIGTLQQVTTAGNTTNVGMTTSSLAFNTASGVTVTTGQMAWNAADLTVDIGMANGVTLQVGQEQYIKVKASEAISDGEAVMFAGVSGEHILAARNNMSSVGYLAEYFIGVATQNFALNEFGYVTVFGKINGLNTLAYTAGDLLYADPAVIGGLTKVEPQAPNLHIIVAAVTKRAGGDGHILVRPTFRPKLSNLSDVQITNIANNNLIKYNSANSRFENVSASSVIEPAYAQANTALSIAQSAFAQANTGEAAGTDNLARSIANSAFSTANTANAKAQAAYDYANTIVSDTQIDPFARSQANSAFNKANTANSIANSAFNKANTGTSQLVNGASTVSLSADGNLTVPGPISGLGNSKLDFTTYGANTAYLTTTSDDSTALFMGLTSAELYANTTVQIRTNTAGVSNNWTFGADGTLTFPDATIQTTAATNIDALARSIANSAFAKANTSVTYNQNLNTSNTVSFAGVTVTGNTTVQHVVPSANVTYDLGTPTARFRDLYLSGNTLYLGGTTVTADLIATTVAIANASFQQANTATSLAQSAFVQANTGGVAGTDNLARSIANSAFSTANSALSIAQSAFAQANTGGGGGAATDSLNIVFNNSNASSYKVVVINANSETILASALELTQADKVVGVLDANTETVTLGTLTNPLWTWSPGQELYLGSNGDIVTTSTINGAQFSLKIGYALSSTKVFVKIGTPVVL